MLNHNRLNKAHETRLSLYVKHLVAVYLVNMPGSIYLNIQDLNLDLNIQVTLHSREAMKTYITASNVINVPHVITVSSAGKYTELNNSM